MLLEVGSKMGHVSEMCRIEQRCTNDLLTKMDGKKLSLKKG